MMAVVIMISAFGCMNGLIFSGARAYFAMARDGLFFRRAALSIEPECPARRSRCKACGRLSGSGPHL